MKTFKRCSLRTFDFCIIKSIFLFFLFWRTKNCFKNSYQRRFKYFYLKYQIGKGKIGKSFHFYSFSHLNYIQIETLKIDLNLFLRSLSNIENRIAKKKKNLRKPSSVLILSLDLDLYFLFSSYLTFCFEVKRKNQFLEKSQAKEVQNCKKKTEPILVAIKWRKWINFFFFL